MFTGTSPTAPWTDICVALHSRHGRTRISGPLFYGFSDPITIAAISKLPGFVTFEEVRRVEKERRVREARESEAREAQAQTIVALDVNNNIGNVLTINPAALLDEPLGGESAEKRREKKQLKRKKSIGHNENRTGTFQHRYKLQRQHQQVLEHNIVSLCNIIDLPDLEKLPNIVNHELPSSLPDITQSTPNEIPLLSEYDPILPSYYVHDYGCSSGNDLDFTSDIPELDFLTSWDKSVSGLEDDVGIGAGIELFSD